MLRKPAFWVLFVLSSLLGTAWAVRHFAEAFPLISLDLRMDRNGALGTAETIAVERGWGPDQARQAARFVLDSEVQSFVELEAGGREAFAALLAGELFSPYTWVVRRFREGETNEVAVRFRPDGRPYGFRETVPEDEPGASRAQCDDGRRMSGEACMGRRMGRGVSPTASFMDMVKTPPYWWVFRQQVEMRHSLSRIGLATRKPFCQWLSLGFT